MKRNEATAERLQAGQELEVTVERAVYRGQGLARHHGQVVFVPRGLPGDRLRVRIASVTPGYAKADVQEVLAPGPGRVEARCPHFAQCGGCAYQHADPAAQAALKEAVLLDALRRAGAPWEGPIPVRPSPAVGWRTRATLHLERAPTGVHGGPQPADGLHGGPQPAGGLRLGFHEEASHRVVDIERC